MSWKLRLSLVAALIGLGVAAWWGVGQWRATVVEQQRERAYQAVTTLIDNERWLEARGAVKAFWQEYGAGLAGEESKRWRRLDVMVSRETGDLARLVWLHELVPDILEEDEPASLLVARTLHAAGQEDAAAAMVEAWRGKQKKPGLWLALEADQLIAGQQVEEARALLQSMSFENEQEVSRRLRLAVLAPNPREAWAELSEAMAVNPRHPDVRSLRAQLLERAGAVEQARVEYVAALVASPRDVVRRDQLAEFYRRHGNGVMAGQTWRDGLTPTAPDFLWLRASWWAHVWGGALGEAHDGPLPEPPPGRWTALIQHLAALPEDRFWVDPEGLDPAQRRLAEARGEVAWLQLLELLRTDQEASAREMLATRRVELSTWAGVPAAVFEAVLRWRASELAPSDGFMPVKLPGASEHVVLEQLRGWPARGLSEETATFLRGERVWSGLLLAAGWPRAAMIMAGHTGGEDASVAPDAPNWYHYGMTASLRLARGNDAALRYGETVPNAAPELRLLLAEMAWGSGDSEAVERMEVLVNVPGAAGERAAWLLATAAAEQGDITAARSWIMARPELAASMTGRTMLARLALAEGNVDAAARSYEELGPASLEAGAFLARQAFAAGNWDEARQLTMALLTNFPGEVELRANLERIDAAERAAAVQAEDLTEGAP